MLNWSYAYHMTAALYLLSEGTYDDFLMQDFLAAPTSGSNPCLVDQACFHFTSAKLFTRTKAGAGMGQAAWDWDWPAHGQAEAEQNWGAADCEGPGGCPHATPPAGDIAWSFMWGLQDWAGLEDCARWVSASRSRAPPRARLCPWSSPTAHRSPLRRPQPWSTWRGTSRSEYICTSTAFAAPVDGCCALYGNWHLSLVHDWPSP